ncbi:hypothetical protein F5884DRAFT_151985 [Xylogone sp. PMI_703]|nr:hypothetical protein F5884DRAFT_151985 [Xylogone sp. PMI_703]
MPQPSRNASSGKVPRKLNFMKCARCRQDKQKCTPINRSQPGQRCDRCIKFDYYCSQNMTAKMQSRMDSDASKSSQSFVFNFSFERGEDSSIPKSVRPFEFDFSFKISNQHRSVLGYSLP